MDNHNSVKTTPTRHLIKDILGCSNDESSEIEDQENNASVFLEQPLNLCISKHNDGTLIHKKMFTYDNFHNY